MNEDGVGGEELIVVPIVDGIADGRVVHLAPKLAGDSLPYKTQAVCGMTGVVYARGSIFANAKTCDWCTNIVSGCGRYASLDRYNEGCRCKDCRKVMADYRRLLYRRNAQGASRKCPSCGGVKAPLAKVCMACHMESRANCGTNSMYARGCRCDDCRAAHSIYMRAWHQRRRDAA